jgi:Transposase and inactivated derivatives
LLKEVVHPADIQDRVGAQSHIEAGKTRFPRLSLIYADQGYTGPALRKQAQELGFNLHIVTRPRRWGRFPADVEPPEMPAFTTLPRRWVIERTFTWLGRNRRLSKDYEGLSQKGEALDYAAMSRLMLRRLVA